MKLTCAAKTNKHKYKKGTRFCECIVQAQVFVNDPLHLSFHNTLYNFKREIQISSNIKWNATFHSLWNIKLQSQWNPEPLPLYNHIKFNCCNAWGNLSNEASNNYISLYPLIVSHGAHIQHENIILSDGRSYIFFFWILHVRQTKTSWSI